MSINIEMMTASLSALIAKEVEKTLGRLRAKIVEAAEIEDDFDIDMTKFAQNTAKKVISSDTFTEMVGKITSAVEKTEKKESAEKKDPDAPKGAKNAFIFFCNQKRQEVKDKFPSLKATEITKKLGEMWKEIGLCSKTIYQQMANQDKQRYAEEIADYEPKEGFKNPKSPKKAKKVKSTAPKRALSAYIFFCQAVREEVKENNPDLKSAEIMSEMGKMWKALSDKKKKPYEKMAEEDKKRYAEQMESYEPTEEEKVAAESKKGSKKGGKVKKEGSKRSPSAYLLFCNENREKVKASNPDKKMTEITSILGKMWSELSDKKKKPFMEKAEKLKAEFEAAKNAKNAEAEADDEEEDGEIQMNKENDDEENDDDEPILGDDDDEEEEKPVIKKSTKKSK